MNKVEIKVIKQEKVDNRVNNTGRPVNKKSSRQIRLAKQAFYNIIHKKFVCGKKFKINNDSTGEYMYRPTDMDSLGSIVCAVTKQHVCNVEYIGRTKVIGYVFVLNKRVNVTINLKTVKFI